MIDPDASFSAVPEHHLIKVFKPRHTIALGAIEMRAHQTRVKPESWTLGGREGGRGGRNQMEWEAASLARGWGVTLLGEWASHATQSLRIIEGESGCGYE